MGWKLVWARMRNTKRTHETEEAWLLNKAAMYVRMSTEHQSYSIENQASEIQKYADAHNLEIVDTYSDGAKSGLVSRNREGLQRLLSDIHKGQNKYSILLIYDVTRFGRYQDTDEGAYYEYSCRQAGIDVRYVAENFKNDNSMGSRLEKTLKRAMAGEYSKELSNKVFIGQCRLINYGYRQGGPAGYGFRRMLLDEHKKEKGTLEIGQKKCIQTDRVILVPGPKEEIEIVCWIYRLFVDEGISEVGIAEMLNLREIKTDFGRSWTRGTVHEILTNEKYIGTNVFNRRSYKLKQKRVKNRKEEWIKKEGAFEAIIEPRYYYAAQDIIRERSRKFTSEEMLEKLCALHQRQGWLSGLLIDECEDMPSSSAYAHRFGSLAYAYKIIGYTPSQDMRYIEINRHIRSLYPEIIKTITARIQELGGNISYEVNTDLIIINQEVKASIVISRCFRTKAGRNRWKIRFDSGLRPDITIVVRMDPDNQQPQDYFVLPALDIEKPKIRLMDNNGLALDCYRYDSLDDFFSLTRRTKVQEIA